MLLIAIMLARVSMTQMQNVQMDALVVITTSEFDVLTHILDSSDLTVYIDRFSDEVRRTLTDICFEKYNQILVLNQYDITKGPIAKLFGRDGFEKPDLQFDFGTVTDLKVRDFFTTIIFSTIFHSKRSFQGSCSTSLNGEMFVFGGKQEPRQVSRISGCGLGRVSTLPFDFDGACQARFRNQILLCFSEYEEQTCHT